MQTVIFFFFFFEYFTAKGKSRHHGLKRCVNVSNFQKVLLKTFIIAVEKKTITDLYTSA